MYDQCDPLCGGKFLHRGPDGCHRYGTRSQHFHINDERRLTQARSHWK